MISVLLNLSTSVCLIVSFNVAGIHFVCVVKFIIGWSGVDVVFWQLLHSWWEIWIKTSIKVLFHNINLLILIHFIENPLGTCF